jgi:transcription initiation factor TFIIIB Brf1 subunit/transcription initiation factor TFIIB
MIEVSDVGRKQRERRQKNLDSKIARYQEKIKNRVCISDEILSYINISMKRLNLSDESKEKVLSIYLRIRGEPWLSYGRESRSIAGAIVYIGAVMSGDRRPQKEIAESLGLADVTVRENYQFIRDNVKGDWLK